MIPSEFDPASQTLQPVAVTKARLRKSRQDGLDLRIKSEARRQLGDRNINPVGRDLDKKRLGRDNLIVLKAAIDRQVNALVGRGAGERHELTAEQLDAIDAGFAGAVQAAVAEVFDAS
jgi:hypothetical protein